MVEIVLPRDGSASVGVVEDLKDLFLLLNIMAPEITKAFGTLKALGHRLNIFISFANESGRRAHQAHF